jgi:hypothetical protein
MEVLNLLKKWNIVQLRQKKGVIAYETADKRLPISDMNPENSIVSFGEGVCPFLRQSASSL